MSSNWLRIRLADVARIRHGYAFAGADFSEDERWPTLVTPGNFRIGGGFQDARPKTYSGTVPADFVLKPGSLIVTMTDLSKAGDTLGYSAVVPSGRTYLHNQRIGLVEIVDPQRMDVRFLGWLMRTRDYRAHVLGGATGSTVRHTSPNRILSFECDVPDLAEQKRIAGVLGAIDELASSNLELAKVLVRMTRLEYSRLVKEHTNKKSLLEIADLWTGGTPKTSVQEYWNGPIPWFAVADAPDADEAWVLQTGRSITEAGVENSAAQILPAGTTIVSARGTVGRLAFIARPMAMNQSCYALKSRPGVGNAFLHFSIEGAVQELKRSAHGSVFDTITKETLQSTLVPVPDADALARYSKSAEPMMSSALVLLQEAEQLRATRDELLPLLMSGKVSPGEVAA